MKVRLGSILQEFKAQPPKGSNPEVLTLTERNGFVRQSDRFSKRLATEDVSGYKYVELDDFAFNPYLLWAGAIARNGRFTNGVISPLYPTFRVTPGNYAGYVERLVLSQQMISAYDNIAFGSVPRRRRSSVKDFLALEVPALPPLDEQRRIAAILDKADELRTKRREALAHLETLTQSIFHSMFGDPVRGNRWPLHRLEELGRWQSGGTPSRSKASNFIGDIPWYSSGELETKSLGMPKEYISDAGLASSSAKLIQPGSLLLGMYDTAALKSGITKFPSSCNQAIAFARLDDSLASTDFVYHCIQIGRTHYMRLQRGVRQKNLNLSMIKGLQVPLPPLDLQQTFAARVAAVERLKETHRKHLAELDTLFASLQHRAFKGEL